MFKALVLEETDGRVSASVRDLDESALPAGNVSVVAEYSTINYKDGLVFTGGLRGNDDFLQTL
jgi:acrylyl-CoA reductase (NADPH)